MKRFSIFFILISLTATFSSSSMFMLSIEKGKVYTESFSLDHVLKSACPSSGDNSHDSHAGFHSSRCCSHNHITLTRYAIPEKQTSAAGSPVRIRIHSLPPHPVLSGSWATSRPWQQPYYIGRIQQPISPLLQSSVLLI